MRLRVHVVFPAGGGLLLLGVFLNWIIRGEQSSVLAIAGFLLVLLGSIHDVEFATRAEDGL